MKSSRGRTQRTWRRGELRRVSALLVAAVAACSLGPSEPTGPGPSDADVQILFVGNSLTYTNDLPGMVVEIAAADGAEWLARQRTAPSYSLEDHWHAGAEAAVRAAGADFVVLQQGPSSLPRNAEHLARWSATYAPVIREAGGRPALFMVWPPRRRWHALDAVRASYEGAAESADGLLAPAGSVWGRLLEEDPALPLTLSDGFHPSRLGTYAAALTIYGSLAEIEPAGLPCPELAGTEDQRARLCEAVREELGAAAVPAREERVARQ